jgi:hypothetical protein
MANGPFRAARFYRHGAVELLSATQCHRPCQLFLIAVPLALRIVFYP